MNQLQHRKRRLPPDWERLASLWVLRVHADKVVSVHDSVDESVKDNGDENYSIIVDSGVEPVKEEDGSVVVNVKEGKLSPLLSKNDEDGVPEVPDLGDVEQPEKVGHRWVLLAVWVASPHIVVVAVGNKETLNCHVGAQHDLRHIVNKLDWVRVKGRNSSLHDDAANENECKVGGSDCESSGEISQWPALFAKLEKVLSMVL